MKENLTKTHRYLAILLGLVALTVAGIITLTITREVDNARFDASASEHNSRFEILTFPMHHWFEEKAWWQQIVSPSNYTRHLLVTPERYDLRRQEVTPDARYVHATRQQDYDHWRKAIDGSEETGETLDNRAPLHLRHDDSFGFTLRLIDEASLKSAVAVHERASIRQIDIDVRWDPSVLELPSIKADIAALETALPGVPIAIIMVPEVMHSETPHN